MSTAAVVIGASRVKYIILAMVLVFTKFHIFLSDQKTHQWLK